MTRDQCCTAGDQRCCARDQCCSVSDQRCSIRDQRCIASDQYCTAKDQRCSGRDQRCTAGDQCCSVRDQRVSAREFVTILEPWDTSCPGRGCSKDNLIPLGTFHPLRQGAGGFLGNVGTRLWSGVFLLGGRVSVESGPEPEAPPKQKGAAVKPRLFLGGGN